MHDSAPAFDASTYNQLVTVGAYRFIRARATNADPDEDGELVIDPPTQLSHEDVERTITLETPDKYPVAVKAHSEAIIPMSLREQGDGDVDPTAVARAMFHKDLLKVASEIIDEMGCVGRFGIRTSINLDRFPVFPDLMELSAGESTDEDVAAAFE